MLRRVEIEAGAKPEIVGALGIVGDARPARGGVGGNEDQPVLGAGGAKGRTDVPRIVDWYMAGKIEIDPMITHILTLEEINKGFDLMHAGESIRSVVVY